MTRQLLIASTAVFAAMLTVPLGASHANEANRYEDVGAWGVSDGAEISFNAFDVFGEQSFANVQVVIGGIHELLCSTGYGETFADFVSTTGSGRSASVDLFDLTCSIGSLQSFHADCEHDGIYLAHFVGMQTAIIYGERYRTHGNSFSASAACTVELNGVTYELSNGGINHTTQK